MEKEITRLIKECDELIQAYYSPHLIMSLDGLYKKLEALRSLIKEKYPYYYEDLGSSIAAFRRNRHNHNMGCISCILALIEKEEHNYVEYVDNGRILELQKLHKNKDYDLTKILQFCAELNNAYNKKSYLTIPLLVRAIIDHIPPIFNKDNFAAVCGGYGTKSFKDSMNHLNNSLRKIADSTVHTQIRAKEILPNATQINFKADLDVLLAEVCRVLK